MPLSGLVSVRGAGITINSLTHRLGERSFRLPTPRSRATTLSSTTTAPIASKPTLGGLIACAGCSFTLEMPAATKPPESRAAKHASWPKPDFAAENPSAQAVLSKSQLP